MIYIYMYVYIYHASANEACDRTRTSPHTKTCKKSTTCLIKKASRRSCETPTSYEKIMCIYFLFHWFNSEIVLLEAATGGVLYKKVFLKFKKFTAKHKARISFLINLQAPLTSLLIILTWKSLNILYRKLMKYFKVLPKENLKSAYKR